MQTLDAICAHSEGQPNTIMRGADFDSDDTLMRTHGNCRNHLILGTHKMQRLRNSGFEPADQKGQASQTQQKQYDG